jgi:signal peptidase I
MRKSYHTKSRYKYLILVIFLIFLSAYFSLFFGRVVQVNSQEMLPSFEQGELLWLKKQDEYQLGDVILIELLNQAQEKQYFLTRVIGIAKDKIEFKNGEAWRNGKMLRSSKAFFLEGNQAQEKQSIWWESLNDKEFPVIGKDLYVYWTGNMAEEEVQEYFVACDYRLLCMSINHQISKDQILGRIDARWTGLFSQKSTQKFIRLFDAKGNQI